MEGDAPVISSIQSLVLDLPPSCIEFCPQHPDYFLVGTYNLQKEDQDLAQEDDGSQEDETSGDGFHDKPERKAQSRNGSIVAFRLEDRKVNLIQTLEYPSAILDLHFDPIGTSFRPARCGVVSSTGTLSTFSFRLPPQRNGSSSNPLTHLKTYRLPSAGEDVLFTSFCWHPAFHRVALTTSTGKIHVVLLRDSGVLETESDAEITHTAEAWTVAIAPPIGVPGQVDYKTFALYSGGDDSHLRKAFFIFNRGDRRLFGGDEVNLWAPTEEEDEAQLEWATPKPVGHTAGVTAILPLNYALADGSRVVVTGSYDDYLRVFAIHDAIDVPFRPRLLVEQNLSGGVWRLKLGSERIDNNGTQRFRILASCMHAGARIVDVEVESDGTSHVKVLARFEEHKSMNYGSDFRVPKDGDQGLLCVSTSFYDKLLCLWEFPQDSGSGVST